MLGERNGASHRLPGDCPNFAPHSAHSLGTLVPGQKWDCTRWVAMASMTQSKSIAVQCQNRGKKRSRNQTGTVPFLTNDPVAEARNSAVVKNWYSPLNPRRELSL